MSQPKTAIDSWLCPDSNGDVYIIDPTTQEAPKGGIPQFVWQDKRLGRGLAAFAQFPVSTEMAFVEHAVASDLDMPDDPMWYEKATSDPRLDAYAYEGLYGSPANDLITRGIGRALCFAGTEPRGFTSRFYRALSRTTAVSASFDPDVFYRKERVALSLDVTCQKDKLLAYRAAYDGPALEQTQRYVAAFAVSQLVREAIMPARMGLLIHRAAKRRMLEGAGDSYRQLVTIGATHRRQEQLLRDLGAQVTARELPLTTEGAEQVAFYYGILHKGVVSPEDVNLCHEQIQSAIQASRERQKKRE